MGLARVHIVHTVKKRGWSGETLSILMLARGQRERGHRVTLAANPASETAKRARAEGIELFDIPFTKHGFTLPWIAEGRRLAAFVKRAEVDVLHCHASFDHWVAAMFARDGRSVLVRTKCNRKRIRTHPLNHWLYTHATDAVVAMSDAVRDDLRQTGFFTSEVPVFSNGIETKRFEGIDRAAARARLGWSGPVLLYVGRITKRKRVDLLLAAGRKARERIPELMVVVAGHGAPELVQELRARFEDERTKFLGHRDDVPELLTAADVFGYPTLDEAFGLAPLEAMAAECPVVLSDEPGFRQFARQGENALLVKDANEDELARAIVRLLTDPVFAGTLRDGGRRTARAFSIDLVVDRYVELYQEMLGSRVRSRVATV